MNNTTNDYPNEQLNQENKILEQAAEILANRYVRGDVFTNPQATKNYIQYKLGGYEREVFAVLLLDNQHRLIAFTELFRGTINAASVYPREVVKTVLENNAAAVIFAHNHPSGVPTPSDADRSITNTLKDALNLIDVRTLDHIIAGEDCYSFAERGWL